MSPSVIRGRQNLLVSTGPRQASVAGCVRMLVESDGEKVERATPSLGWVHRGVEKLAEETPYAEVPGLLAHVDHLAVTHVTTAFAMAMERLASIPVPPRAAWLRAAAMEIERVESHMLWLGTWTFDAGLPRVATLALREAGAAADVLEALTGARSAWGYVLPGGVARSPSPAVLAELLEALAASERGIDAVSEALDGRAFAAVARGLGAVDAETARTSGASGPCLRACGIALDARHYLPVAPYRQVRPAMPLGGAGDCWDRCFVRIDEARWSTRVARELLSRMPEGRHVAEDRSRPRPPAGEAHAAVESSRGELGVHIVSDGSERPYRLRLRSPSFHNLGLAAAALEGCHLDAVPFVLGSIDLLASETER